MVRSIAADLYALGCLFFEALTGQPPFQADNEMALRWAHANDPRPTASAVLPALGQRYDGFLSTALAIDPDQRFASGRAFAEALTAAHDGQSDTAVIVTPVLPHAPTAVGPPTPMPPPTHTPQPPPPVYPAYAYVTPPPAPAQQNRSGNPMALIVLGVVALAGIAAGALAATGAFSHGASTQTITSATAAHANVPRRSAPKPVPVGTTSCGGDLSVGPDTSCPFARNVEQAYDQSSGGENKVTAYSPATGLTYTMNCTGGSPHVCTGGKGATIYFTSGPTSTVTSATPTSAPSPSSGLHKCDPNISVNSQTSCPFGENTFVAYWRSYEASGVQSETTVSVYSPTTHRPYAMACTTKAGTVNCSGGNSAFVTFPLHAVEVYSGP